MYGRMFSFRTCTRSESEKMERISIDVFSLLILIITSTLRGQQQGSGSLPPPKELVSALIDEACRAEVDSFDDFYLNISRSQNTTLRNPPWPNHDTGLPGTTSIWRRGESHDFIPTSVMFWDILFNQDNFINSSDYTWCVYIFSMTRDVHGCIRGNMKWGTSEFKWLGLLEKLSTQDIGGEFGLQSSMIQFSLETIDTAMYTGGNALWHNAMVTVNINTDEVTIGEYYIINANVDRQLYIADMTGQEDVFLIEGVQKTFFCDIYGTTNVIGNGWRGVNRTIPERLNVNDSSCDVNITQRKKCSDINYVSNLLNTVSCSQFRGNDYDVSYARLMLRFQNPTRNDTGIYTCYLTEYGGTNKDIQTVSIFVYVVFIEVPGSAVLKLHMKGWLQCTVKAPINSNITVSHNGNRITQQFDAEEQVSSCDDSPKISVITETIDEQFSYYYIQIYICSVSNLNVGRYEYQVGYWIPTDHEHSMHRASITADVIVKQNEQDELSYPGMTTSKAIGIGIGVLLGSLVTMVVFTVLITYISHKAKHVYIGRRVKRLNVPLSFSAPTDFYEMVTGKSSIKPDEMEFSLKNLEFHELIGKGRFGKVIKSSAHGIIPHFPSINTVAVKVALANNSLSNEMMAAELDIMKSIEAHQNICNLLAYCTVDVPIHIIMEYACHGSLKKYLDKCRQAVLQYKELLCISTVNNASPGVISESDVCNCAFQIASGLEHLEAMRVVHCDLAARNILVCEGFLLKIGDFGIARRLLDDENYIEYDGITAAKWTAPEALESKYSFKSDVWSYGVIIWEIASYGAEPFSDFKIGVNLNKLVKHLQDGNRLPQPDGLSTDIYEVLLSCWSIEHNTRPSSSMLKQFFQDDNSP